MTAWQFLDFRPAYRTHSGTLADSLGLKIRETKTFLCGATEVFQQSVPYVPLLALEISSRLCGVLPMFDLSVFLLSVTKFNKLPPQ